MVCMPISNVNTSWEEPIWLVIEIWKEFEDILALWVIKSSNIFRNRQTWETQNHNSLDS